MAVHELYVGGPGTTGFSRSMYPRPTFNPLSAAFQRMTIAAHKGPSQYALTRVLDFKDSASLKNYVSGNTVAQGDQLNIQVIPKNSVVYGFMVEVETPQAGVSLTFRMNDGTAGAAGTAIATAVDCSVAGSKFAVPAGAAWVTDGAVDMSTAHFTNVPKMLQAVVTALGAGGFGALRLSITPLVSRTEEGQY